MPIPQLLGRDDVKEGGSWDIRPALPLRGSPSTCVELRQMNVPMGDSPLEASIRVHEMMHAKVSPSTEVLKKYLDRGLASERTVIVAEETRVNWLANQLGFPIKTDLADGREFIDGKMLASSNWKQCMYGYIATVFTGGQELFMNGVEEVKPEWAKQLFHIGEAIESFWIDAKEKVGLSGISVSDLALNMHGFYWTYELAIKLEFWAGNDEIISDVDNITDYSNNDKQTQETLVEGKSLWDDLRFSPNKPSKHVVGAISKKRTPMQYGKNPRRINRLYSDPQKRIFDRTTKSPGGIVLVDGSGSMRLSQTQIKEMLLAAPGCTVVIYSSSDQLRVHKPEYNMHFLAQNGKMCEPDKFPDLYGGNGCDLPAIKWAVSKRKSRKTPVIWVTDGYVHSLATEIINCALFAKNQGVLMASNANEAIDILQNLKRRKPVVSSMPSPFRRAMPVRD